jgi:hypothetical protein
VFCIGIVKVNRDVAKVDQDVAHVANLQWLCTYVPMFYLYQMYVVSVFIRMCKNRSGCYIYMHVASVCFKCFKRFIRLL